VQYVFPGCRVLVDERQRYVETRFPDGTKVGSTPNGDGHTMDVAADLGYGDDTWAMSRDHEIAHTWLAYVDGVAYSPTMWRLAHPYDDDLPDDDAVAEEEQRVLDWQKALDKSAPRPWSVVPTEPDLPW
jgi:hypothetical protein